MASKIMATYSDEHGSSQLQRALLFFLCDGVRIKAQYCHLEINQVLTLEYLHVVIRVLFILNIAVIANTGISSRTKLTQIDNSCFEYHGYRPYWYIALYSKYNNVTRDFIFFK